MGIAILFAACLLMVGYVFIDVSYFAPEEEESEAQ